MIGGLRKATGTQPTLCGRSCFSHLVVSSAPRHHRGTAAVTLTWKPIYSTGDESLDEQHRRLFDRFNRLETLMESGTRDSPAVHAIVDEIGTDLRAHFECEESCMSRHRCPMADKNKQEHDQLLALYQRFEAGFSMQKSPAALADFHRDAQGWLLEHICFVDVHLRRCLKPASGG